jgi:hypothetical protein
MRAPLEQLSVRFDRYPVGGRGDPCLRSLADKGHYVWVEQTLSREARGDGTFDTFSHPACGHRTDSGRELTPLQPWRSVMGAKSTIVAQSAWPWVRTPTRRSGWEWQARKT